MSQQRISWFGQVNVYIGKAYRTFINERMWKAFISSAIIAAIVTWVAGADTFLTYRATSLGAFALVCACIWIGIFSSIQSVCRERAIIKREYRTGLYLSSYITARMFYEMVISLISALIVVVVVYIFRSPPTWGVMFPGAVELFVTFFLIIFAAAAMGLLLSCVAKTENAAMTVMPFVLILQLVMSGVVFELTGVASFISNLTISKWGVRAVCTISDVNTMMDTLFIPDFDSYSYLFTSGHLVRLWVILLLFVVLFGVFSVFSLRFIEKDER